MPFFGCFGTIRHIIMIMPVFMVKIYHYGYDVFV